MPSLNFTIPNIIVLGFCAKYALRSVLLSFVSLPFMLTLSSNVLSFCRYLVVPQATKNSDKNKTDNSLQGTDTIDLFILSRHKITSFSININTAAYRTSEVFSMSTNKETTQITSFFKFICENQST